MPRGRMVEWGILALVVVIVLAVFAHYVRLIQGQGERAAVLSTLGALRTALVIDHVQRATARGASTSAPVNPNPFLVLQSLPLNYRGEMGLLQALAAPPGGWVFDPQCVCIGYLPLDAAWGGTGSDASLLWFKVVPGPGARGLAAQAPYVWQGVEVR